MMKNKWLALLLVTALLGTMLTGCKDFGTETGATEASIVNKDDEEEETDATTKAEEEDGDTEDEDEEDFSDYVYADADKTEFTTQDYSNYFDDNGFVTDVKALDYMTLPDFSEIKVSKEDVEPSEEDIEASLEEISEQFRTQNTERAVEDGDQVSIDFTGSLDGVEFEGGAAEDYEVTAGSDAFVDDFLTQIIGHMPGENFDITVTFPDDYETNTDLAGKDVNFNITINYVYDNAELTDEWIAENKDKLAVYLSEELNSYDELLAFVKTRLYNNAVFSAARSDLLTSWSPDDMPDNVFAASLNMTRASLYLSYNMTLDEYAEILGYDDEKIVELVYYDAKMLLLHQAIAETEGWEVTEADYKDITGSDNNEEFIELYGKGYLSQYVLSVWAQEYISAHVTVE